MRRSTLKNVYIFHCCNNPPVHHTHVYNIRRTLSGERVVHSLKLSEHPSHGRSRQPLERRTAGIRVVRRSSCDDGFVSAVVVVIFRRYLKTVSSVEARQQPRDSVRPSPCCRHSRGVVPLVFYGWCLKIYFNLKERGEEKGF